MHRPDFLKEQMLRPIFLIRPHVTEGTYIFTRLSEDAGFRGLHTGKESGSKNGHSEILTFET